MSARRCSRCALYWPNSTDYAKCAECKETTDFFPYASPMSDEDAVSRVAHVKFAEYEAIWEQARAGDEGAIKFLRSTGATPPPVGPLPEDEGTQEARELMEDFWAEVGSLVGEPG